ncbi:MAG: TIGR03067 domain-containing protein [Chloroflexi bacterium]|nr:TIGR03067 domain-containing protein [Chloroflexota bacterium]
MNNKMKAVNLAITVVVAMLCGMFLEQRSPAKNARESMEGNWACESAVVNGKALPESTVALLRLKLTRERYVTTKGSAVLFESSYTTDPSQDPKHINIVETEGELKGKEALGIYSLAGDALAGKGSVLTFDSA